MELQRCELIKEMKGKIKCTLRSTYKRDNFFKAKFDFIEPVEIFLVKDNGGKICYMHYFPVQLLRSLLKVKRCMNQIKETIILASGIFEDVADGAVRKQIVSSLTHSNDYGILK